MSDERTPDPAAGLEALLRWRDEAVRSGLPGIGAMKETYLRQAARSKRRAAGEIAVILPASLRRFAPDIAQVLADPARGTERSEAAVPDASEEDLVEPPAEPSASDAGADGVTGLDFVPYVPVRPLREPVPVRAAPAPGGSLALSWAAPVDPDPAVVYRVVSGDEDYPPYSPDVAEVLVATTARRVLDARPFQAAVRHVQVWVHTGETPKDAAESQPVLHATGAFVAAVVELHVVEDQGHVVGQWTALPGTTEVQILRIPAERGPQSDGDPQYRILAEQDNLHGFVDRTAVRGRRYRYQVTAVGTVDDVALTSVTRTADVAVSAELVAVDDLNVVLHGDPPAFDLTWRRPPAGRVVIYRSAAPPSGGVVRAPLAEGGLEGAGLAAGDRLAHPESMTPQGRVAMRGVLWPPDQTSAYLTPVTLLEGRARVGASVLRVRTGAVVEPVIVERVHEQVVTFGWPSGADVVLAYRGMAGQEAPPAPSAPHEEISRHAYERHGGMHLQHQLAPRGCSLHLVPVAFVDGLRIGGPPARVDYPGLLRMDYRLEARRSIVGDPTTLTLTVRAEIELPHPPPLALVHNPDRLPLEIQDGHALAAVPLWNTGIAPTPRIVPPPLGGDPHDPAWAVDVTGLGGYVRLFVDLPSELIAGVALFDPPVSELRLVRRPIWAARP